MDPNEISLSAALGPVLRRVERALGIEIEVNPLSRSTNASRALRDARIAEGLGICQDLGDIEQIEDFLRRHMPEPIRASLIKAARETVELQAGLARARLARAWRDSRDQASGRRCLGYRRDVVDARAANLYGRAAPIEGSSNASRNDRCRARS